MDKILKKAVHQEVRAGMKVKIVNSLVVTAGYWNSDTEPIRSHVSNVQ